MSGTWVLVCGPSGAGKDTVIAQARAQIGRCPGIVFARRLITRPAHPASDHSPVERAEFDRWRAAGEFALHWRDNGFDYAIPADYARQVAVGCTVVVNGSRTHLVALRGSAVPIGGRYPRLRSAGRACSPAVLNSSSRSVR